MHPPGATVSGYILLFIIQIVFLILFAVLTDYDDELLPKNSTKVATSAYQLEREDEPENDVPEKFIIPKYSHFQDIHVMIFIGFAFLMTFLRRYGFSATGFNLFVGALVIQWAIIARGLFELENGTIKLSLENMIGADIATASVLISMGCLLGRITPIQLLIMGLFEIVFFAVNEYLQIELMRVTDIGGSITVHAFGAYFGLAISFILRPKNENVGPGTNECSSYNSDTFAMIGTCFLWIFWPSFNSVLVDGPEQHRAILHTYLSLAAATVTTFILSAIVSHENKLDMVHIQNSTLAGGVAIGSVCNLIIYPFGAVIIGILAGILSVLGYRYLTPLILSKFRIADTCGVHNLHGMPAVLSAIFSALYAALATSETYGDSLITIFPAMDSIDMHNATVMVKEEEFVIGGYGRSAAVQGLFQLAAIGLTLAIAIVSGLFTGFVLKSPVMRQLELDELHTDDRHWEVPAEN